MENNKLTFFKTEWKDSKQLDTEVPDFLNEMYMNGDKQKYMKMYDRIAIGYDVAENFLLKVCSNEFLLFR